MRTDDELRKVVAQMSELHSLPPDKYAKQFLEICGDCTGEEIPRLKELCMLEAEAAYTRAEAALRKRKRRHK
jgi:hypothetical protein